MNRSNQTYRMKGHDYAVPGTYEITMVVAGRRPVFGKIVGTTRAGGEAPRLEPSALGRAVLEDELPKISHVYPMVAIWQACLMPDHLHLIVRINAPLPAGKHLGIIMGAFKGGVSRAWWRLTGVAEAHASATVAGAGAMPPVQQGAGAMLSAGAMTGAGAMPPLQSAGAMQLQSATVPVASATGAPSRPPLFEPNYNDHILMRDGQLENWKRYLRDNPRRLLMRREYPRLFERSLCVVIEGIRYSAFGNMLLLRQPEKHQVFFHRYTNRVRTEETNVWTSERERLVAAAESGDVLVTPGVSECEKRIKQMALARRFRLVHVQSEPIGPYWKPERSRFEACASGTLLIVAPGPRTYRCSGATTSASTTSTTWPRSSAPSTTGRPWRRKGCVSLEEKEKRIIHEDLV